MSTRQTLVTWTFDDSGGNFRGFSHCWSTSIHNKTNIPLSLLDSLFEKKLEYVETHNGQAHKSPRDNKWYGDILGVTTHQGYLIKAKDGESATINISAAIVQQHIQQRPGRWPMFDGKTIYEYEHQDFKDLGIATGERYIGYPYLTAGGALSSQMADINGRVTQSLFQIPPDTYAQTALTFANETWGGSATGTPGSCYRVVFGPRYPATTHDVTLTEQVFQHPNGLTGKYFGPRSFNLNTPQKPWAHFLNSSELSRKRIKVHLVKPTQGGYGIKNINGEQLYTKKLTEGSPLRRRPCIWWGSKGHCDAVFTTTAGGTGNRLNTLGIHSLTINSLDAVTDGGTIKNGDRATVTMSASHGIANSGGHVGFVSGFTGIHAHKINGFRRIDYKDGDELYIWSDGTLFDDEGANGIALSSGTIHLCGDGYGNLNIGTSTGATQHSDVASYSFATVDTQASLMNKWAFAGRIHDGTPGGSMETFSPNLRNWNGYSGGIFGAAAGVAGGPWGDVSGAGSGFDGALGDALTMTFDRFKACTAQTLSWDNNRLADEIGGWITHRVSEPGVGFGVGNGDTLKIRVYDPLTQAFYGAKFVDANGTPIAALAGPVYFGTDATNSGVTENTYSSTGWSNYFDKVNSQSIGARALFPNEASIGIGLQLYEIDTDF